MRELLSRKNIVLAFAFAAVFALAGYATARLMPPSSYATVTIGTQGALPEAGVLDGLAVEIDSMLSDSGLPSRVTASRAQVSIMVPPSSLPPEEVRTILDGVLKKLPDIQTAAKVSPRGAARLAISIEKINKAEEVLQTQVSKSLQPSVDDRPFDFEGFARAVIALDQEHERLATLIDAQEPELSPTQWQEPKFGVQTQGASGLKLGLIGALFGFLMFAAFVAATALAKSSNTERETSATRP